MKPFEFEGFHLLLAVVSEVTDDAGGIADGEGVGGDIFGDYGTGADHYVVAYRYSGAYRYRPSNPYTIADSYRLSPLNYLIACLGIQRVTGSVNTYVRTDEDVVTKPHLRLVKDCEVEVGEEPFADEDVASVVAKERLVYLEPFAMTAQQFAKYLLLILDP